MDGWSERDRHRGEHFSGYDVDDIDRGGDNSDGFDESRTHRNGTAWDDAGYDSRGYDRDGFDLEGWDVRGRDHDGKDEFGIAVEGVDVIFARLQTTHKAGLLAEVLSKAMESVAGPNWWELDGLPQVKPPVFLVMVRTEQD